MEKSPSLHLDVVAIEKGTFEPPLTKVANFPFVYMCVCVCVCVYIYICIFSPVREN